MAIARPLDNRFDISNFTSSIDLQELLDDIGTVSLTATKFSSFQLDETINIRARQHLNIDSQVRIYSPLDGSPAINMQGNRPMLSLSLIHISEPTRPY